ncbi:right-handed parallel beta-helix repeat-containing protein [Microlunatus soli]|uniref:Right handed beta helix region n=1 Tax=Microlunatus soli TaxID=630515 RepID=A0A1H2AL92_9ACTN|nr:right-handed parallel beta-helix repeat-containing protein [Microlunatus soli]SDT46296.1 Right handed beta helix region [Microlunatus soli]
MRTRRAWRRFSTVGVAVVLALLSAIVGPLQQADASTKNVPGQFVSKLYTEALGRVPTSTEWNAAVQQFADGGCTAQTLADLGQSVYTSADFARLGYDNPAKLTTLFRGAWNAEADPGLLAQWQSGLSQGESWSAVVAQFFVAPQFTELVPKICRGGSDSSATSYGMSGEAADGLPRATGGFAGTEEDLQRTLDQTPAGGTVQLAGRAVVRVTKPLRVPSGVTLTTSGEPATEQYAEMGRLVRAGDFDAAMVDVADGARLSGVWIDGARNNPDNSAPERTNVRVLGGTGTAVVGNKISNTAGSASVQVLGESAGHSCSRVVVSKNLITAYSNDHYLTKELSRDRTTGTWSDGIDVGCSDSTVTDNQIVDTGGVGIMLYRGADDTSRPQRSTISGNTIASAGVPMYAAIAVNPLYYVLSKGEAKDYDFGGSTISENHLWTAPNTHFVIGISIGSRPWYGGMAMVGANSGHGVSVAGNGTSGIGARVRTGIAVSGMDDVRITSDPAVWQHGVPGKSGDACPSTDVAASKTAGTADGLDTEVSFENTDLDGCMGEP